MPWEIQFYKVLNNKPANGYIFFLIGKMIYIKNEPMCAQNMHTNGQQLQKGMRTAICNCWQ